MNGELSGDTSVVAHDVQTIHSHHPRRPLSVKIVEVDNRAKDLPPSHANFDRSKIPDSQYIELLLFEIKELKSACKRKDSQIDSYQKLLKAHNLSPVPTPTTPSFSQPPADAETIPVRSARRRISHMPLDSSSVKSTSNLSIEDEKMEEKPAHNEKSAELDPSSKKLGELDSSSKKSVELDPSSKKLAELDPSSKKPIEFDSSSKKSIDLDSSSKTSVDLDPGSAPITATPTKISLPHNNSSSTISDSKLSPVSSKRGSGDKSVAGILQRNVSNSSLYKSRIKLPPTLQNQHSQRETMNVKDLSVNILPLASAPAFLPSDTSSPGEIISSYGAPSSAVSQDSLLETAPPVTKEPHPLQEQTHAPTPSEKNVLQQDQAPVQQEYSSPQLPVKEPVVPTSKQQESAPAPPSKQQPYVAPAKPDSQTTLRSPAPQDYFASSSPAISSNYDQGGVLSPSSLKYESPLNQLSQMSQRSTSNGSSPNNNNNTSPTNSAQHNINNAINTQSIASPIHSVHSNHNQNPTSYNANLSTPSRTVSGSQYANSPSHTINSHYSNQSSNYTGNSGYANQSPHRTVHSGYNAQSPHHTVNSGDGNYAANNYITQSPNHTVNSGSIHNVTLKQDVSPSYQANLASSNNVNSPSHTVNSGASLPHRNVLTSPQNSGRGIISNNILPDNLIPDGLNPIISPINSIHTNNENSFAPPSTDSLNSPDNPKAFLTPEEFMAPNSGRFPSRLHDLHNQPSQEEIQSYISSPNQHAFVSPVTYHQNDHDNPVLRTPVSYNYNSNESVPQIKGSVQTPGSSFNVIHSNKMEPDDVTLLIKPEEFHTISVRIVSSISVHTKKSEDPNFTLSVNDKATQKEMWRIRKTYSQAMAFDNEIRPIVDCFGLPTLPDKQVFNSSTPVKIEGRNEALQNFFNSIFSMPHIPHSVLYKICRFLSLDFVNPLDDFKSGAVKEGFLIRRYKGLGSTWKVRWCQVDGPFLEVYESPGGPLQETVKLKGAQIGRQSGDTVAEDKGYRHAFLILEPSKSSKLSSFSKHFFCAESDQERDEWIEIMMQYSENGLTANDSMTANSSNDYSESMIMETPPSNRYDYQEDLESNSKPYSSISSNSLTPGLVYTMNHTPSMDVESNNTVYSQDQLNTKEAKKLKKRSIFPFRYKAANSSQSNFDEDSIPLSVPQTPVYNNFRDTYLGQTPSTMSGGDVSIQLYLDQMNLDEDVTQAIFGREIGKAFELSNHDFVGRRVPSIVYRCLDFLLRTGGVYEEGIFRLSGSTSNIRQLKDLFNSKFDLDLFESSIKPDMHTIAGLLKLYLRELPCPIFGLDTYNSLQNIVLAQGKNGSKEILALMFKDYINNPANIDTVHYDACYVIFKFLRQIIANSASNRMNLRNVCIVFVPTLNVSVEILITFLVDFDCIFEGGQPVPEANREKLDLRIPNF